MVSATAQCATTICQYGTVAAQCMNPGCNQGVCNNLVNGIFTFGCFGMMQTCDRAGSQWIGDESSLVATVALWTCAAVPPWRNIRWELPTGGVESLGTVYTDRRSPLRFRSVATFCALRACPSSGATTYVYVIYICI
jgi:hypothetical protein